MPSKRFAVLFDLDGVVRQWPVTWAVEVEQRHNLPAGGLAAAAFEPELLDRVVTGRITDRQWRVEVARSAIERWGPGADAAVVEWSGPCGLVDDRVLTIVRAVRRRCQVALFTNATDRLSSDLDRLGIAGEFDVIINSSQMGWAKPSAGAFDYVQYRLGLEPPECILVDDLEVNVQAATAHGWTAHRYLSAEALTTFLMNQGLLDRASGDGWPRR